MAVPLLLGLVLAEAGLATLSIRSRSQQTRRRLAVRAAALGILVLLVIIGGIQWGLRYYALALWLFILLAVTIAAVRFERGSGHRPRDRRIVLNALAVSGVTFLAISPALVFPEYSPLEPTGAFAVATSADTLTDPRRMEPYADSGELRSVNVGYWYPDLVDEASDRTFPLVVFSHGGTGIRTGNESLFLDLASHGYVVASIDHPHHSLFTTDNSGSRTWIDWGYFGDLRKENARAAPQRSHAYYEEWMTVRMGDVSFVLDHLLAEAGREASAEVYRLIDTERIGVGGHSLGGSAALGIGRARDDVRAVIALESPFMADIRGVRDGRFIWEEADYPLPVLLVYSDSAWSHLGEWPQYAKNHELLSAESATVVNLHIAGVGHLGLTDLALASPVLTWLLDGERARDARGALASLNEASLEFLDAHLKDPERR